MNAVIYLSPWGRVTGSLIDSLEYLIALKQAGIPVRLVYMGKNQDLPGRLIRDRYELAFDPLEDALFLPLRWKIVLHRFDKVLVPYTTYRRVFWWMRARETFVLPSMWMRRDARWPLGFPVERGKVTYLLNPKQHAYKLKNVAAYEKKLLLGSLRRPEVVEDNLLVNCQSAHKRHSPEAIRRATEGLDYRELIVLCEPKRAATYEQAGFQVLIPPVEDLFAKFSQYLYLPALNGYDENPRLLIESAWLGKNLIFPENDCADPHLLEKYQRLKESKESKESFMLREDDLVLQRFRE